MKPNCMSFDPPEPTDVQEIDTPLDAVTLPNDISMVNADYARVIISGFNSFGFALHVVACIIDRDLKVLNVFFVALEVCDEEIPQRIEKVLRAG